MDGERVPRVPHAGGLDPVEEQAARDVATLIDELEQTLNGHQRHLLHRLRLCAETLGAVRASSMWRHGPLMVGHEGYRS